MKKKIIIFGLLAICIHSLSARNAISRKPLLSRSIASEALGQNADAASFSGYNKFYIGTAAENADKSLTTVILQRNSETGNWEVVFNGLAPDAGITVNGDEDQKSTFYASMVNNVALTSPDTNNVQYVIATKPIPEEASEEGGQSLNAVGWIDLANKTELTNLENKIKDAADAELKNQLLPKAAASQDTIFVAVPASGSELFGTENSGLVRLKRESQVSDGIKVQKLDGGVGEDKAYKIDLVAVESTSIPSNPLNEYVKFAVSQDAAINFTLGSIVDLFWDQKLQRIYITLTNATCATESNAGACSLLVGYVNSKNEFYVQPTIPSSVIFELDNSNNIIGYKSDKANGTVVSTFKARTMHTSTGRDYIITNGDASAVDTSEEPDPDFYKTTQISTYALPLVSNLADDNKQGLIAKKNDDGSIDFATPVDAASAMQNKSIIADKVRTTVGSDIHYLCHSNISDALKNAAIQDIQVIGDTVYIALAGSREKVDDANKNKPSEAGIFASTAIFNENREIRAWTPWQRAMGYTDKVYYFGFDKDSGRYWYMTPTDQTAEEPEIQTAKVTMWNSGDAQETGVHAGSPLINALKNDFNDGYGLTSLTNFDDETVGFKTWRLNPTDKTSAEYPAFSMMVAGGLGKIALIQTGARDDNKVFVPTQKFEANTSAESTAPNVFIFNTSVTQQLGFVTCAEVSRVEKPTQASARENNPETQTGWLFVGGENGIVVMVKNGGYGWNSKDGLSKLGSSINDYPGTGYSFVMLTPPTGFSFNNIYKLVADGKYLFILTPSDLYRLEMSTDQFASGTISSDKIKVIASVSNAFKNTSGEQVTNDSDQFFDFMIIDDSTGAQVLAIGTSQGLWVSNTIPNDFVLTSILWNRNINPTGEELSLVGPAFSFNFISSQRGGKFDANKKADGNLYVTAINSGYNHIDVYRFNVQDGNVKLFNEPYNAGGRPTPYFYRLASNDDLRGAQIGGPLNHVATEDQITDSLATIPDPNNFIPVNEYFKSLDLGYDFQAALNMITTVQDTASGALYIPGDFIVFVNE